VGKPIAPGTGNEYHVETDYQSGDGRLEFRRTYNSTATSAGTLGANWQHNFTRQMLSGYNAVPQPPVGTHYASSIYSTETDACSQGWAEIAPSSTLTASFTSGACRLSNGQTIKVYISDPSFAWTSNPSFPSYAAIAMQRPDGRIILFACSATVCTPNSDVPTQLSASSSGFTLTDERSNTESYTTDGVLTSVSYVDGYQQTYAYNTDGTLSTVSDNRGRQLQMSYTNGLLTSVTLPDGSSIAYGYTSTGAQLQSVTYPDSSVRTYQYANARVQAGLTGIVDENQATYATIGYDSQGRANSTVLGGGIANGYSIVYNSNGSATVTDPLGAVRTYNYQQLQGRPKLTSITGQPCSACGPAQATYDSAGYPQSTTDFNNNVTQSTYDDTRGLETQRIEGNGTSAQRTINTTWDANFRFPDQRSVVNASSVTESLTKWVYNSRGQVLSRCEADPAVSGATSYTCGSQTNAPAGVRQTTYTYCEQAGVTAGTCPVVGLALSVDGPRTDVSDVTTYTYYQTTDLSGCATTGAACHYLGDLQKVTNALGQITTYISYDKNGRVTRMQDANGTYTDMTYHVRGWLLTRTVRANADGSANASLDATTTYTYDNAGQVKKITQPDGAYLNYTYDAAHRLTDITDNLGNAIHYTLDASGNRTKEDTKDPSSTLKRTLSRQYDQLNRLTKSLNAASATVQQYTNPADAPPTGITYTDGYDGNGNAIYSIDGNSVGTEQQYDPLNRLVKTLQDHAGTGTTQDTTTQYTYDARNNLRSVIDPDNLTTSYTYDGLNNLTALSNPDTGSTSYTYDAAGNRKTQTDARGVTSTYSYDVLNRLTGISYPTTSLNVTYTYDQTQTGCYNTGRLTAITDSSGSTGYCYDRRGNVVTKQQTTGSTVSTLGYAYTVADRISSITYPSGAIVTYTRNSIGQITGVTYQANATATAQTLISSATYLPFGPLNVLTFGNGRTLTKTYDSDYAIDKVVSSGASGLIIDATVDVLGHVVNASNTVGASPPTQKYLYDPLYRLTTSETGAATPSLLEQYTYGKTGDRTSVALNGASATSYSYTTGTHRLSSVGSTNRTYDNNGNTLTTGTAALTYDDRNRVASANGTSYAYNGKGERVAKTVSGATTTFVYNEGGQLTGEYTGSNAQEYVYLDGAPIGIATGGTTNQLYYVEADQLGSPRVVVLPGTTTSSDTVVWNWGYFGSAFGTNAPSPQTLPVNLRFPGQYYDTETGLHYNYFRDYEPAIGRYVESDPIGLRGGANTYSYVKNNPLRFLDPRGLEVTWKGSVSTGGLTAGFGGMLLHFDLTSECKCNKQYRITGFASFLTFGGGIGWKEDAQIGDLSGSGGKSEFEDAFSECPDPDAASGPAWISGINIVPVAGASLLSRLRLGHLKTYSFADGPLVGFDISATATLFGASAVWDRQEISSCCGKAEK
jgi:RHS repeat-associated protein